METWNNIPGVELSRLMSDPRFPLKPDSSKKLESLVSPMNIGDNYGLKLTSFYVVSWTNFEYSS